MPKVIGRAMKLRKLSLKFSRASSPTVQATPTSSERITRGVGRQRRKARATMHSVARKETTTALGTSSRIAFHMSA